MTVNQPINEIAVDRREETVVTQQPGFAATEQVIHDVAAELLGHDATRLLEGRKRIGLAPGAVEREHQLPAQPFA